MMPQTRHWECFPYHKHYAFLCSWGVLSYTLGCMSFLEYMGFVLVVFPLKCGFIIVQIQMYYKVTYQMRKVKNKGTILVLVWSFLVSSLLNYLINTVLLSYHDLVINSVLTIIAVMLPVAGWLADVQFGRYKVIRCTIWTMWISSMLLAMSNIVFSLVDLNDSKILRIPTILLMVVLALVWGDFKQLSSSLE